MGDERQEFTNNFDNYESTRFDFAVAMLMTLFSKENQDVISKKIREQLIDVQTIDDSTSPIKGLVYANDTDDIDKSRIFYIGHEKDKVAYSWRMIVHELVHFMGKPDKETIENEITSGSDRSELGGTQIFDFNTNSEYGNFFNECGADLIGEIAMTTSIECRETNPQIHSASDIIYTDNRYQKTDYDSLSTIARLMVAAMDNNFSNQSYDRMIHSDSGLIDRQVQMINQETGEIIDTVPTNDYIYAMAGHGKHLEKQFDKYSEEGSYREMCTFLDSEIKALQSRDNHIVDKDKIKEQLLRMADMVNNKMYILQSSKCISQQQRDAFVGRFNLIFNQALQEYDIGPLTLEDIKKTVKSMNATKSRENIELETQDVRQDNEDRLTEPETIAESNDYEENLQQILQENSNKLSIKQRIAQFLQRNHIFTNVSFVDKFVHNQLDVLPQPIQETRTSNASTMSTIKERFINELTNFGEYRNLPPIQTMSDAEKITRMQQKMSQKQEFIEDNERG